MECPKCGYVMEPFATECARCQKMASNATATRPTQTLPPPPSPMTRPMQGVPPPANRATGRQGAQPREAWENIVLIACVVPAFVAITTIHAGMIMGAIWGGVGGCIGASIIALIKHYRNPSFENNPDKDGQATTGFVLGIIGLITWIIPLIGLPVCIIGAVCGGNGLPSTKQKQAVSGIIMSVIGCTAGLINSMVGAALHVNPFK